MQDVEPRNRLPRVALILILALVAFPTVVQTVMSPVGSYEQNSDALQLLEDSGADITGLTVMDGDVSTLWGVKPTGYVNVLGNEQVIYFAGDSEILQQHPELYDDVLLHEYGHIVQRRLVEQYSTNSYELYERLIELNTLLESGDNRPGMNYYWYEHSEKPPFMGLEMNADCIAILLHQNQFPSYVDEIVRCDSHQLAIAQAMLNGEWPTSETVSALESSIVFETGYITKQMDEAKKGVKLSGNKAFKSYASSEGT